MKLLNILEKLKHLFSPKLKVGGLEISHQGVKLFFLKGKNIPASAQIELAAGILKEGRVNNAALLLTALKQLHEKIAPPKSTLNVVVSLPSELIYAQTFSVPVLQKEKLEEAIELNLQMISPSPAEETFSDWQELKEGSDARHLDLLGAFASAQSVRQYLALLAQAGFNVLAVEFPALSLSRLIKERWADLKAPKPYLTIYLNNEGVLFLILKNGNLAFSQFNSWTEILTSPSISEASFGQIKERLTESIQKILNYYFGRRNENLEDAILISPFFNYEIVSLAKEKFSLNIANLTVGQDLNETWFVALGASLRGLTPRAHDEAISLMETNTQTEYYQQRVLSFSSSWRNIILTTLGFMLLSFVVVDTLALALENKLKQRYSAQLTEAGQQEVSSLTEQANQFNRLLSLIELANSREVKFYPFLAQLKNLAGAGLAFDRLFIDQSNSSALISGTATNELTAINFKNRLGRQTNIASVSLPLSNLKQLSDGRVSFVLTLNLKGL